MDRISMLSSAAIGIALACSQIASGATLTGIVTDASGKPLENARVDHTGKTVVVAATELAVQPSPDELLMRRAILRTENTGGGGASLAQQHSTTTRIARQRRYSIA
jgi:hypothetical protein